jgi:hypothetical protein
MNLPPIYRHGPYVASNPAKLLRPLARAIRHCACLFGPACIGRLIRARRSTADGRRCQAGDLAEQPRKPIDVLDGTGLREFTVRAREVAEQLKALAGKLESERAYFKI